MTTEQMERMRSLFAGAQDFPPDQQAAFLARACPDDAALRQEVAELLQCGEEAGGFLEEPAFGHGLELLKLAAAGKLQAGDSVGDCRVVSLLGVGGMGEVYLAEDTVHGRKVALKLIGQSRSEDVRGRHFRHERKVLAALNHPYIARLYDSGVTADGQAYLVMEYVEGERLDRYCEVEGLNVAERLALFRKVGAAVAYAHQNLVVHRDLKPANIRVTPEGEPKLLDFGIAKLLDPEGSTTRADPTLTLAGAMTPEYASPEQIKGEAITTASDVYSLGVVLYELLAGQRPYAHLQSRRPDELARAICEEEPPRLSTVATHATPTIATGTVPAGQVPVFREPAGKLRRLLEGDLDNIVAKALRKEPGRRYPGALAFADDIRRHCEGLPVTARKDTLGYRAGKFVRRNKAGVAAAALVLLALVGGLIATALEARRADRRFEDVRRLAKSNLFELEPKLGYLSGSTEIRRLLIQRALEYLDSLAQEAGGNRELRRELGAGYLRVGDVLGNPDYSNLGDIKGAMASYHKALDLLGALVAADPGDAPARDKLADVYEQIGVTQKWENRQEEAMANYQRALLLRRKLLAEQPRSLPFQRGFVSLLMCMGDVAEDKSSLAEALGYYQEAMPVARTLADAPPRVPEDRVNIARFLVRIAKVQKDETNYQASADSLAQADELVAPVVEKEPDNQSAALEHWYIAFTAINLFNEEQATAQALEIGPRMMGFAEALVSRNSKDTSCQHDLAISHAAYADALQQAGRWQETVDALRAGVEIETRLVALSPENSQYLSNCGTYRCRLARARVNLGQDVQAAEEARLSQGLLEAAIAQSPDDPEPRKSLVQLFELQGDLCEKRAQPAEATEWFRRALAGSQALTEKNMLMPGETKEWAEMRAKYAAKTASAGAAAAH